jgi:WD40-like Beta Propeller Repeat
LANGLLTATLYAACTTYQVARKRRTEMFRTTHGDHLRATLLAMAMLAATLVALAGAKPAHAAFPDEAFPDAHNPVGFEKDGDIWVATKMHLANLTPDTAAYTDVEPAVSPDGRYVAFASDRDGDFEIYTANVFTGEVQRVTDNTMYDYNPSWWIGSKMITYIEPLLYPEDVRIFSLRITHEELLSSRE